MANEFTYVCSPSMGAQFGRLQPANWTAPDGSWVLALGADTAGLVADTWPAYRLGINGTYPTGFAGGETLQIAVDGGSTQTITFQATDQTLEQVIDRINATLTDAEASDVGSELKVEADSRGLDSQLEIVGGTGAAQLGHIAAVAVGHGGVRAGDYFGFRQSIDLTTTTLLGFACKFIQPENTDIAFAFKVSAGADTLYTLQPAAGETVDFTERRVNVSGVTGSVYVSLIIEAVRP